MQYGKQILSLLNTSKHKKFQIFGIYQSIKISEEDSRLWLAVEFWKTIENTPVRELLAITFVGDLRRIFQEGEEEK